MIHLARGYDPRARGLRSHARAGADPRHRSHVCARARPARRRGARPQFSISLRARGGPRRARAHGPPDPGAVRGRRRRHGLLRDRDRGIDTGRFIRGDHGRCAHFARDHADLPLRNGRAEEALASGSRLREAPGRVRAHRARRRVGRGQHANDGRAARRLLGDQRVEALHHERGDGHHLGRHDHGPDRRGRDLERRRRTEHPATRSPLR